MLRKLFLFAAALIFIGAMVGAGVVVWGYGYVTRDLPNLVTIDDYHPAAVTKVFSSEGTLIAEFYRERRYPVKIDEVPLVVRHAFLAAEDASFYSHPGIDFMSIVRAFVKNLRAGSTKQGASTITQQVVKNLLLTPERKFERKLKEAILAYRLEERLSKDEIFEIYLNQIFLGNNSYGVKAAALTYFRKELADVTMAEAALLAGLPKAPSRYSPVTNMAAAKTRQGYVLTQMVKAGFATAEEATAAGAEDVKVYPATPNNIYAAPYFVTEVRKILQDKFRQYDIDADGLQIYTTVDLKATNFAQRAVRQGLRDVDKRRGWRGPIAHIDRADREKFQRQFADFITREPEVGEVFPALVTSYDKAKGIATVASGSWGGQVAMADAGWAKKKLGKEDVVSWIRPQDLLSVGDVIEVLVGESSKNGQYKLTLDQIPNIEGAATILDPHSGRIVAMVGGYSFKASVLNRATQALRQPGSTFKPVVYLAAVDGYKYTPATIVHDTPKTLKVGDQFWSPGNYDEKYLGPITLRTALERSRNLVSVDIVSRIGINPIIKYARLLGIESPLGRNPSIALGSSEVTLLELTRAYGVFAAKGMLVDSYLVDRVLDRTGASVFDHEGDLLNSARQVIPPSSAFVMANVMKGVVQSGTATVIKPINRPVAGKTGTTNDMMDAWFIGFTPEWVCGVWTGFDQKKTIGDKETGGRVAAPIWLKAMQPFLEDQEARQYEQLIQRMKEESARLNIAYQAPERMAAPDFQPPEDVVGLWVQKQTGQIVEGEEPGAIYEYFVKGTEPTEVESMTEETASYLDSPDL